jgi:hypothetical protein
MNRCIRYDCSLGETFARLYDDVFSYAELMDFDPTPLIHWLAVGQMSPEDDPLVNFASLNTPRLITALSSITDIQDLELRVPLYPDCVHQIFRFIPKSVKGLIFTCDFRVSPSLFLEFFRSLSKVEVLRIFVRLREDVRIIWPAGCFTNASVFFSDYPLRLPNRRSVRAHYVRDCLPRWVVENDNESLIERSLDSSETCFTDLNEEIMGWFRMKKSLIHVEMLCSKNF